MNRAGRGGGGGGGGGGKNYVGLVSRRSMLPYNSDLLNTEHDGQAM